MTKRGIESLRWLAYVLDDLVPVPGTRRRIGLDPLLGLLPGGGDVAGGLLSAYTMLVASRLGAPPAVLARMAGNILVDALAGAVPLLGDLFDLGWKANRRNMALIERYIEQPRPVQRNSRLMLALLLAGLFVLLVGAAAIGVLLVRWVLSLF